MLKMNPTMLGRLTELEHDLLTRRARAEAERWLGEIDGIELTLIFLRGKREEAERGARRPQVELGLPAVRNSSP